MDLGLDSLLETEILRQTSGSEISIEVLGQQSNRTSKNTGLPQEDTEPIHEQDHQWRKDVVAREKEKYKDLEIRLEDITDKDVIKSDLSMKCNLYIHDVLNKWEKEIQQKEDPEGSEPQLQTKQRQELLHDTKMSLFPCLVKLRKGSLPKSQLVSVATVLFHLQRHEWDLSLQSYMQLSLGNVAWPIGVTSVGIHARSAHSKITGSRNTGETDDQANVATIMLDDSTRKWTTSLKRLITVEKTLTNVAASS